MDNFEDFFTEISENQTVNERFQDLSNSELYEEISEDVRLTFLELGIADNKAGEKYWIDALYLLFKAGYNNNICKEIYNYIGEKNNRNAMSIEKSMRYCIQKAGYLMAFKKNYVSRFLKDTVWQTQNNIIMLSLSELIQDEGFQKLKRSKQFAMENALKKDMDIGEINASFGEIAVEPYNYC